MTLRRRHLAGLPVVLGIGVAAGLWHLSSASTLPPERVLQSLAELESRVAGSVVGTLAGQPDGEPHDLGLFLVMGGDPIRTIRVAELEATPNRLVLLVHGLDEPGSIWNTLTPRLMEAGYEVAQFWYPNDGPVARSAEALAQNMEALRSKGTQRIDIVAHSMGGLVARDMLTRDAMYAGRARGHERLPDVERLILVGTPNKGSPWARVRALAELREQTLRLVETGTVSRESLLRFLNDGTGEAGRDLMPGSAFLKDLNARPNPAGVAITTIVGRIASESRTDLSDLSDSWIVRELLGKEEAERLSRSLTELSGTLGDGVVSVKSAGLDGVADSVVVEGSHRGMLDFMEFEQWIRTRVDGATVPAEPPAIPIILERLEANPPEGGSR